MESFENLNAFYLGREYDPTQRQDLPNYLLYDSKDLLTHAVCVGMTGSGKTGLCLSLLEEAAIDGIPAIVIDPKGDMANLFLTFPSWLLQTFAHGLTRLRRLTLDRLRMNLQRRRRKYGPMGSKNGVRTETALR